MVDNVVSLWHSTETNITRTYQVMKVNRTYKYRLYPNKRCEASLETALEAARVLYNSALEERILAFEKGKKITFFDQTKQLKIIRADDEVYQDYSCDMMRRTSLKRLDLAFQAFFRRVKTKEKAGFPRFKGKGRFDTLKFVYGNGSKIRGKRFYMKGIGEVRINFSRDIPEGATIKEASVVKNASGKYFVCFCLEMEKEDKKHKGTDIGIDLGISEYAVTSEDVHYDNPRMFKSSLEKLQKASRRLSRRVKGSNRRRKARHLLAVQHQKITNQRNDFLHKLSKEITQKHKNIYMENLSVKHMIKNRIYSQSIMDASWGKFVELTSYKAEEAGGEVVVVNPKNTTRRCSSCQEVGDKIPTSQREFLCKSCGFKANRDYNASVNIFRLGSSLRLQSEKFDGKSSGQIMENEGRIPHSLL